MCAARDRPLVFIFGQHRSGTTILYNALASSAPFAFPGPFHIAHFAEYRRIPGFDRETALAAMARRFERERISHRFVDDIPAGPLTPEEYGFALPGGQLNRGTLDLFRSYCDFVGGPAPRDRLLLFKNPRDLGNIAFIHRNFPQARFVFLHRHPGPVITSRMRELRDLFRAYSPYQAIIEPGYARMPRAVRWAIGQALRLETGATLYLLAEFRRNATYLLRAMAMLPQDRFRSVNYETLCAEPARVLGDLLDFLGLARDGAESGARLIAARQASRSGHPVLDAPWAARLLRPYLKACGYRAVWPA